ncbi:MAG: hypothetical protein LC687_02015, partial [Actinobacteria bacterium]|nr:hypothetical protein [Actinomycetota bacterium]
TVGNETFDGTVDADGNYAIDVDGFVMTNFGQVDASVSGQDEAGDGYSASTSREYTLNTPPVADPVSTTAEVVGADTILPDGLSGSPLLFKEFSVDGTVDGDNPEPSPTLRGNDEETPIDELTFTLESIPGTGTLFVDVDGDGTYATAQQDDEFSSNSTFYWVDDGSGSNAVDVDFSNAPDADSGLSLYAFGYDGQPDNSLLNFGNDGVGISDDSDDGIQQQVPNQLGYRDGNSQTLVMDFDDPAHDAEVSISRLIKNEGEVGKVEAYLDGAQVGTWTFSGVDFSGVDGATLDGEPVNFNIGGSNGSFTLPDGLVFDQLRFTATEYADDYQSGESSNDSSEYFIDGISYKTFEPAEFTYSVTDGAGDGSDAEKVSINTPQTDTAVPESFETTPPPSITVLEPDGDGADIAVNEAFLQNGTRADEAPADGEPGTTATGQFTLNAPAGLGLLSIAAAGLTSGDAGFDDGKVTLNADQLAALEDEPVVIKTPEGNTLSLTGFDAESGTVDYEFELTGPVTNDNGEPLNKEPISLELTDSNDTPAQASINIAILDDDVDTTDDIFAVSEGSYATGNVLANDSGADVELEVTRVKFGVDWVDVLEGGTEIQGENGTLHIYQNGDYTYQASAFEDIKVDGNTVSEWSAGTAGLWGFSDNEEGTPLPLENGLLDIDALNELTNGENVGFKGGGDKKAGAGVSVNQSDTIDNGESLLVQLDGSTNQATVGLARLNAGQDDVGHWTAYN